MSSLFKAILSINYIYWLILSAILYAGGEILSKKFALSPKFSLVILILIIYMLDALVWLPAIYQKNQLSVVGTIWAVITLAATVSIGVFMFGEKLNLFGIIGIILAFASVVLLSMA
jgi:multidrug transporter EmrE-like cation transporter